MSRLLLWWLLNSQKVSGILKPPGGMLSNRHYRIGSKSAAPCLQRGHTKSSGSSSPS